jgi:hypothetical protein
MKKILANEGFLVHTRASIGLRRQCVEPDTTQLSSCNLAPNLARRRRSAAQMLDLDPKTFFD